MLRNIIAGQTALPQRSLFILKQHPEPAPSAVGSTKVFAMENSAARNTAMQHKSLFILRQYPEPLPSALGTVDVLVEGGVMSRYPAMEQRSLFLREQYPEPAPNRIGVEDLPGGFKRDYILTGQIAAIYQLAKGVIEINGVKVLVDLRA